MIVRLLLRGALAARSASFPRIYASPTTLLAIPFRRGIFDKAAADKRIANAKPTQSWEAEGDQVPSNHGNLQRSSITALEEDGEIVSETNATSSATNKSERASAINPSLGRVRRSVGGGSAGRAPYKHLHPLSPRNEKQQTTSTSKVEQQRDEVEEDADERISSVKQSPISSK